MRSGAFQLALPCIWSELGKMAGKAVKDGLIVRAICILDHPLPGGIQNAISTPNRHHPLPDAPACQIVLAAAELSRKNDVHIVVCGHSHHICASGRYVAAVSTVVETDHPEQEIEAALALLGPIHTKLVSSSPRLEANVSGDNDGIWVTSSCAASPNIDIDMVDVLKMWQHIHGREFSLTTKP